mmetsp:Transcript_29780/g.72479  ORF Transcript_29780/g.72479 Transcript_29780/m.72479 type:complete len:199 (-) Transcript_29780:1038-1634(-)
MTGSYHRDPLHRVVDDQQPWARRGLAFWLVTNNCKGDSPMYTNLDHLTEQMEKQEQHCDLEKDDEKAHAPSAASCAAMVLTLVLWFRPWIAKVAFKWPRAGRPLLDFVTKLYPRDPWAFVELGTVSIHCGDDRTAIQYFLMAAQRGSAVGTLCLGDMVLRGKGVTPDHLLGRRLIEKARFVLEGGTGRGGRETSYDRN